MALAGGAHIKIAGHRFYLALDQPRHYVHNYDRLSANRTAVQGDARDQNLVPDYLKWSYTDWSGGEGNKFYNPDQPTVYYQGQANGRNPGELLQPPARTSGTFTVQGSPTNVLFTSAYNNLYMATNNAPTAGGLKHIAKSTDGTTWTGFDAGFATTDFISAMASDQVYIYVSSHESTSFGTTGAKKVRRILGTTSETFVTTTGSGSYANLGMAFLPIAEGGRLFAWTGKRLTQYDTTTSVPVDGENVFNSGVEALPSAGYGGIVACENSVVFYLSVEGHSQVWEYGLGASGGAKPLWKPPRGFVIKDIAYTLGNVVFVGTFDTKKALFAVSLVTRQALFLGYVRPTTSLGVAGLAASFGSEVLFASTNGHLFSYDLALDAVSEIDDATALSISFAGVTTWKSSRIAAGLTSATVVTTYAWGFDDSTLSSTQSTQPEMPAWDFGLPEDNKVLLGFSISTSTLSSSNKVTISYDLDNSGSYTSLTAVTSGSGNQFVAVGASPVFNILRFKVKLDGTAKLFNITARAFVLTYLESWELLLDLRKLPTPKSGEEAINRTQARQIILAAIEAKNVVAFLDGMPFEKQIDTAWDGVTTSNAISASTSGYRSYNVLIQPVEDEIDQNSDGFIRIRCVNVTP